MINALTFAALVVFVSMGPSACGGGGETPATNADAADGSSEVSSADSTATDASIVPDVSADASPSEVPTESAKLLPWLQARSYASFPRESKVHASSGPHGGSVRTYITSSLDASLASKALEHPQGVGMVKELYTGTEVSGWAVAVKTASTSAAGDNWYWYEIFGTTSATKPVADGKGLPGCKGCHSGGRDFVLSPYPLQ